MTYELMDEIDLEGIEFGDGERGSRRIYPFPEIAIGGGFRWPDDKGKNAQGCSKRQSVIAVSARGYAKRKADGSKFRTTVKDGFVYVKRIA